MWVAIKAWLTGSWEKVVEWAAIIGSVAIAARVLYQHGKDARVAEELKSVVKDEGRAHAIEDENRANLRPGDAAKRLRDDWS